MQEEKDITLKPFRRVNGKLIMLENETLYLPCGSLQFVRAF